MKFIDTLGAVVCGACVIGFVLWFNAQWRSQIADAPAQHTTAALGWRSVRSIESSGVLVLDEPDEANASRAHVRIYKSETFRFALAALLSTDRLEVLIDDDGDGNLVAIAARAKR